MKKFTNISGAKVGQEPTPVKMSNEELEINQFKCAVMKLMDNFLTIRAYGNARPELVVPTKIVGKEMFVEALSDLLNQKSNKDLIKSLESLKSTNGDWKSIEDKINTINTKVVDIREEKKINDIIKNYGSDEDNLKFFLEGYTRRTLSKNEALKKHDLVEDMITRCDNTLLKIISKSYLERYESLMESESIDS